MDVEVPEQPEQPTPGFPGLVPERTPFARGVPAHAASAGRSRSAVKSSSRGRGSDGRGGAANRAPPDGGCGDGADDGIAVLGRNLRFAIRRIRAKVQPAS